VEANRRRKAKASLCQLVRQGHGRHRFRLDGSTGIVEQGHLPLPQTQQVGIQRCDVHGRVHADVHRRHGRLGHRSTFGQQEGLEWRHPSAAGGAVRAQERRRPVQGHFVERSARRDLEIERLVSRVQEEPG